jgi:hypothetical protein
LFEVNLEANSFASAVNVNVAFDDVPVVVLVEVPSAFLLDAAIASLINLSICASMRSSSF